jgi:hypothetical protein
LDVEEEKRREFVDAFKETMSCGLEQLLEVSPLRRCSRQRSLKEISSLTEQAFL